jgi:hypothetical protein
MAKRPPAPERPAVGVGARVGVVTRGKVPANTDYRKIGVSEVPGLGSRPTNAKPPGWETTMSPEQRRSAVEDMRSQADADTPKPW